METTENMQDIQKAIAFFQDKVAFTTGPIELSHMLESHSVNVVDVCAAEDFEKGHVPGAINLPHGTWENPQGLSRDKINVVYCYSQQCHLAANACVAFASKSYPVMELEGGFEVWKEHELDIEQGQSSQMRKAA
jgi:rhodanese-related sulfurtransferase